MTSIERFIWSDNSSDSRIPTDYVKMHHTRITRINIKHNNSNTNNDDDDDSDSESKTPQLSTLSLFRNLVDSLPLVSNEVKYTCDAESTEGNMLVYTMQHKDKTHKIALYFVDAIQTKLNNLQKEAPYYIYIPTNLSAGYDRIYVAFCAKNRTYTCVQIYYLNTEGWASYKSDTVHPFVISEDIFTYKPKSIPTEDQTSYLNMDIKIETEYKKMSPIKKHAYHVALERNYADNGYHRDTFRQQDDQLDRDYDDEIESLQMLCEIPDVNPLMQQYLLNMWEQNKTANMRINKLTNKIKEMEDNMEDYVRFSFKSMLDNPRNHSNEY